MVKISDFRISKMVNNNGIALHTYISTLHFRALEIRDDENDRNPEYTNIVDIWSLGYIIYYILA